MSFTVYLDESGITDPQICVVAGFAAPSLCWSMFTEEWRGALSEYGVGEFHAQVFFGRDPKGHMVGEYKGWSQDKAGNFLKQLIGVTQLALGRPLRSFGNEILQDAHGAQQQLPNSVGIRPVGELTVCTWVS